MNDFERNSEKDQIVSAHPPDTVLGNWSNKSFRATLYANQDDAGSIYYEIVFSNHDRPRRAFVVDAENNELYQLAEMSSILLAHHKTGAKGQLLETVGRRFECDLRCREYGGNDIWFVEATPGEPDEDRTLRVENWELEDFTSLSKLVAKEYAKRGLFRLPADHQLLDSIPHGRFRADVYTYPEPLPNNRCYYVYDAALYGDNTLLETRRGTWLRQIDDENRLTHYLAARELSPAQDKDLSDLRQTLDKAKVCLESHRTKTASISNRSLPRPKLGQGEEMENKDKAGVIATVAIATATMFHKLDHKLPPTHLTKGTTAMETQERKEREVPFMTMTNGGSLRAAIWKNQSTKNEDFYRVSFYRTYLQRGENGEPDVWKTTTSFRPSDLKGLQELATKAEKVVAAQQNVQAGRNAAQDLGTDIEREL